MFLLVLTSLYHDGLSFSTLNVARSAVSQLISRGESSSIGENVLIKRFFKGVFRNRPPTPRYTQTWDIGQVLTYLKNLGPTDSLDLKTLTLKTVMLLALCSAQRCQTIHLLNTENIQATADSLTVTIPDLLKQSRPGVNNPRLHFTLFYGRRGSVPCKVRFGVLGGPHSVRGNCPSQGSGARRSNSRTFDRFYRRHVPAKGPEDSSSARFATTILNKQTRK